MARLPYIEPAAATGPARELLERVATERGQAFGVYRMLAHSPASLEAIYGLGSYLWQSSALDPRLVELVILRVAQLTGSQYEWARHRALARRAGVPDAQVEALALWATVPGTFDAGERAALAVTDGLTEHVEADAGAVDELRRHFDDQGVVELVVLAGMYGMIARVLRTLAVDPEPGDEPLPTGVARA